MRFSILWTLIDNNIRHHSGQNLLCALWDHFDDENIVVDKSTDNAEPRLIC